MQSPFGLLVSPAMFGLTFAAGLAVLVSTLSCGGAPGNLAHNDAGCDQVPDGGPDAGPDAGPDGGPDAGPDAGPDGGGATLLSAAQVDGVMLGLLDAGWFQGAIVGVLDPSGEAFYAYGSARDGVDGAPTPDTEFEIGSITKAFTGLLLAQSASVGIKPSDGLQSYLPSLTIPTMAGQSITLQELATHTSGVQTIPTNFTALDPLNPYPNYTVGELQTYLASASLLFTPGTQYSYSNLGFGLLGYALGQARATTYRDLLGTQVLDPLDLQDTVFDLSSDQSSRFADGHDGDLNPTEHWTWENDLPLEAAGALRSTARDLLKLAAAELHPDSTSLSSALTATQQVLFDDQFGTRTTLGLFQADDGVLWKGGDTYGFSTAIAFDVQAARAVVVLFNTSFAYHDVLAIDLHRIWRGDQATPEVPATVQLSSAELGDFVGTFSYRGDPSFTLQITQSGNELFGQSPGQSSFRLYPDSSTSLYARVTDIRLFFYTGADGKLDIMNQDQGGIQYVADRAH
jgi:serine-type D-Ala-D-Ala carboxypeptidase/endopeptidase